MKILYFLFIQIVSFTLLSCSSREVIISSDFDHGSIGNLIESKPGYFIGSTKHWSKRDGIGDQYYWFYFKANQVKNKELTFQLNELEGVYRGNPHIVYTAYTQPVFSYDQEKWNRIKEVSYDSARRKFVFSQFFEEDSVWIAYAHPYPFHRVISLISSIQENKYVEVNEIAKTREGRNIDLVTITDAESPPNNKKVILLMAMQHAGEDAGSFYLEGMINFLLSDNKDAKLAREKFIYVIIPMMNPDGVYNGTSRYNIEMEDLNNIWLNDEINQPEVIGIQQWVSRWYKEGNKIDLFLDIHNHTQLFTYNVFIFKDNSLDSLGTIMDKYWPTRIWHSEPKGSSHAYFLQKNIPSGSVELTQSFSEEGAYLTISDYQRYGERTVLGMTEYFMNDLD